MSWLFDTVLAYFYQMVVGLLDVTQAIPALLSIVYILLQWVLSWVPGFNGFVQFVAAGNVQKMVHVSLWLMSPVLKASFVYMCLSFVWVRWIVLMLIRLFFFIKNNIPAWGGGQ